MPDDFITSLTYEVKEEILERYFYERRLIELQIPPIYELAQQVQKLERKLMLRLARLYELMIDDHYATQFINMIGIKCFPFKKWDNHRALTYKIPAIKLRGLTSKGKFKKLLLEEYHILCGSAEKYRSAYENLREECKAVNYNMEEFAKNYDLMVIINFLKAMDPELVMKKYFLGSNFTPEEIGTVGEGLAFKQICFEHFQLTEPPELPHPAMVRKPLVALAGNIYSTHTDRIKTLLRQK
jgi:hypothetical protein